MSFHSYILQYASLKYMNIFFNNHEAVPNKMNKPMELLSPHIYFKTSLCINLLVALSQDPNKVTHYIGFRALLISCSPVSL